VKYLISAGLLVALLPACSHHKVAKLGADLKNGQPPSVVLKELEETSVPERDKAQYLLDEGILHLYTGDIPGSSTDLQAAKEVMDDLEATSITETTTALTVNETLRSYSGNPTDRVLVHEFLALNYLLSGDRDSARVEVLQSDLQMDEFEQLSGQLASMQFLGGLIYELNGEYDDAMISYRRAYAILTERQQPVPKALQQSLLNMSKQQGFDEEYVTFESQFGLQAAPLEKGQGELIVFYFDGVVTGIKEAKIPIFSPELGQLVSVALPYYPPPDFHPGTLTIQTNGEYEHTAKIENIDNRLREDLDERLPAITAVTLARVVMKYQAVHEAEKENELAGILVNIAAFATEVADTRSWNMLPFEVEVARVPVDPDASIMILDQTEQNNAVLAQASQGRKVIVVVTQVGQQVYCRVVSGR